jgi:hypothetical protein
MNCVAPAGIRNFVMFCDHTVLGDDGATSKRLRLSTRCGGEYEAADPHADENFRSRLVARGC